MKVDEWSAWLGDLRVAAGGPGVAQAVHYAIQYAEEGEVVVRRGNTARGRVLFRVAQTKKR